MALIFPHAGHGGPQVHALIIGVGGYRHLPGGHDPRPQVIPQVGILKQLTTAPRSALAFAEYLTGAGADWQAPLGSIELLVSTEPNDDLHLPAEFGAPSATIRDIRTAYGEWRARSDAHPDNVAIFYFCGHGLEKEEQYLLTEDFGEFPDIPWLGAFAFETTQQAMRSCKAATQLFIVDACREITDQMKDHDITVQGLATPNLDATESENSFVMRATAAKETALGKKNGVAYATQALIKALEGAAAQRDGQGWVVRTGGVSDKITDILRQVKPDQGFSQRSPCVVNKSTELVRLTGSPVVSLEVTCVPDEATQAARLTCQKSFLPGQPAPEVHEKSGGPLVIDVDAGIYVVGAQFGADTPPFKDAFEQVPVAPPFFKQPLHCEKVR